MALRTKVEIVDSRSLLLSGFPSSSAPQVFAKSSKIIIQDNLFSPTRNIAKLLQALLGEKVPTSFVIITDSRVSTLYGRRIRNIFSSIARTDLIAIPQGEGSKTLDQCSKVLSELSKLEFDKNGVLVLLGGGVVGDLGGFVASIYKRGVRYIQVPTTLLAQVDSSIGGKTGVDMPWGKNQVGTIYQPLGVLIDPQFLDTLPDGEILNGIGEMVKYGVVANEKIFASLERESDFHSLSRTLIDLIEPCCKIKARIVTMDEFEQNIRYTLNYGHTIAHAIEASSKFRTSHGASVLIGMLCEGWIAQHLGIFEREDFDRQEKLILRILARNRRKALPLETSKIMSLAFADKKNIGGKLMISLPERIGRMHKSSQGSYKIQVSEVLLKNAITRLRSALE
jgi:3-dehydroquinate synthase